ncbi:hypothetical protein FZC76_22320 [Sutcliffiella horikoshii]|uniref:Uncharacterized protein n=1 Tax=Sutcliffiella horikoshii TaxID=79883 RepID=A0A5D4SCX1_9BACI|nr:hypothetical protein [Sutcliffiella horikoshii]TYS59566.1 hypothetical protein FZC76_22320 [Sutcliffiella horikoshii]
MRVYEQYRNSLGEFILVLKKENITGNKLIELKKDIALIQKLSPVSKRLLPLKNSHDKFEQWKASPKSIDDEIIDIVTIYLSNTSSFIDQWNSFLKREYSDLHSFFDKEKRTMYEKTFAYRLIYNLRNMSHHTHQLPYNRLTKSIESAPLIVLEKRYFLDVHKGMQPSFRKELEELEVEAFNLVEIISESYEALIKFHEKISSKLTEKLYQDGLLDSIYRVLQFYNDHQENNGVVGLTKDELNPRKVLQKDFRQTLGLEEIPYNLACFGALSCKVELTFTGIVNKHRSNHFPYEQDGTIYKGADLLSYKNVKWVKVHELVLNIRNNKSVYSVLYMVDGLPLKEYERKKDEFESKKRKEFIAYSEEHYNKMKPKKIDDSAKILIIYFDDEKSLRQEILFSGSAEQLRQNHLANDWDGFNLGDSFHLDDVKVRVYVKRSDLEQKNIGYFIGPDSLNPNKINYDKLRFQEYSDK